MLVTLPFVMLLLDYWPLRRLTGEVGSPTGGGLPGIPMVPLQRLMAEKVPLIALAAASSVVTFMVQEKSGSVASGDIFRLPVRAANAVAPYAGYIVKTAFPYPLAVFYPHPGEGIPVWTVLSSAACLVLITAAVLRFRRSRPALPVGWFRYLGTLVPVIGLVQVGFQGMSEPGRSVGP